MPDSPYSISTGDALIPLVCGRQKDLKNILDMLLAGDNIALFGEKRIGKTLVLYLVRDIINHDTARYDDDIYDRDLKTWLVEVKQNEKLRDIECEFLSLQSFSPRTIDDIIKQLQRRFSPPQHSAEESLYETFERVSQEREKKIIVLIDEIEHIFQENQFEKNDRHIVLQQLLSTTQLPNISFILAGAEFWSQEIRDQLSQYSGSVRRFYLSLPERRPLRDYLLEEPLSQFIEDRQTRSSWISQILDYTGGKPCYCQSFADELIQCLSVNEALSRVKSQHHGNFRYFFETLPSPGDQILQLLAHRPHATTSRMASLLRRPRQEIASTVHDLQQMGKVYTYAKGYRLRGQLFEEWGRDNLPPSFTKRHSWARLVVTLLILIGGSLVVSYTLYQMTEPPRSEIRLNAQGAGADLVVSIPRVVERGEKSPFGNAHLYLVGTNDRAEDLTIHFLEGTGNLEAKAGSVLKVPRIKPGKRSKQIDLGYWVAPEIKTGKAKFKLAVEVTGKAEDDTLEFDIPLRRLPLKRFWGFLTAIPIGLITAAYLSFEFRENILSFFASLGPSRH